MISRSQLVIVWATVSSALGLFLRPAFTMQMHLDSGWESAGSSYRDWIWNLPETVSGVRYHVDYTASSIYAGVTFLIGSVLLFTARVCNPAPPPRSADILSFIKRWPAAIAGSALCFVVVPLCLAEGEIGGAIALFAVAIGFVGLALASDFLSPPPARLKPLAPRPAPNAKNLIPVNVIPDQAASEGSFSRN
jgi:hypothetical protein